MYFLATRPTHKHDLAKVSLNLTQPLYLTHSRHVGDKLASSPRVSRWREADGFIAVCTPHLSDKNPSETAD